MANTASAKKTARQSEARRVRNLARRSSVKTAVKKVLVALEEGAQPAVVRELLSEAASQLGRARGKGLIHANTAARKLSRLTRRVVAQHKSA
jgi:small subunit ribosomal protein S20